MSTMFKYRVHEVAKDFKIPTKQITEILTKYATAPKNHMQVLTVRELDLIFEYLTSNNQIESIEEIYAVESPPANLPEKEKAADKKETAKTASSKGAAAAKTPAAATADPAAETESPAASVSTPTGDAPAPSASPAAAAAAAAAATAQPAAASATTQATQQADKPYTPRQAPQKRVIDTSGATINIDKYDERLDSLVPERAENMSRGKERITRRNQQQRQQTMASGAKQRQEERDRMNRLQLEVAKKAPLTVKIPEEIGVGELATRMKKTGAEVVRQLVKLGVMASLSDIIDHDTAALVAIDMGCKVEKEVVVTIEERLIDDSEDSTDLLKPRAPVVVVMGHVDHGKTSLLDRIREESVAAGEAGGITQHIGAYQTYIGDNPITFLDTPGHEAFTSMRARGAKVTDIAILIIAADDGIMPQTVESINHARAAQTPIIVAINKIDVEGANVEKIKQQLTEYDLITEEWGGDTIVCPISAKTGEGIDHLLEMVLLTAEMSELKANPDRLAKGTVIEARLDKGRGPIMTVLVQNGTLNQGDTIIAGTAVGNVRVMMTEHGERITSAGPSVPVEIAGMSEVPDAGDLFNVVTDERMARELAAQRKDERKGAFSPSIVKVSLEDLFDKIKQGELKDLNIIVKADVQGSIEAIKSSVEKLSNDEVRVRVIHSGVGAINESDVMLASTSSAIIVGFNVRPDNSARDSAARNNVDMRMYRVIYDCINEIESAIKGMLAPKYQEVVYGQAEVRELFKSSAVGTICGSYVLNGRIIRNSSVRLVRDGIVVHEGALASLRRFKDDVREVATNFECGIALEKYNDIKEGDIIECFAMEQIPVV
ncbi:MAG: translation initiation factor IF-2 [Oscillospiraceae bacterium]|nr:translation initiation factor IF-2 [Oscillospiraceae bacterium]